MLIRCSQIQDYNFSFPIKLVAGKSGLNHTIRWVHYIEDPKHLGFIKGGELLINSGVLLNNSDSRDISLYVTRAWELNACGIIFKISQNYIKEIPDVVRVMADELKFPIFEIPEESQIVEISETLCKAIINFKDEKSETDRLVDSILYNKAISGRTEALARNYFYNPGHCHYSLCVKVHPEASKEIHTDDHVYFYHRIESIIEDFFSSRCSGYLQRTLDEETILVVNFFSDTDSEEFFEKFYLFMIENFPNNFLHISIGTRWTQLSEMKNSVNKARYTAQLIPDGTKTALLFYDKLKLQRVFYNIEDKEELNGIMMQTLGALLNSGSEKQKEYLETLCVFFDNNCSHVKTADALFIHINTLRYRLHRIEEILSVDMNSFDDLFSLKLAISIYQFMEIQ